MHGFVMYEFQNYIKDEYGEDIWDKIKAESELEIAEYQVSRNYPDNEVATLFTAASKVAGQPVVSLLEHLGSRVGPKILNIYAKDAVDPDWTYIDIIRNVTKIINHLSTIVDPSWRPADIFYVTDDEKELIMRYESPLKICSFTIGVIKGIAQYFNEDIVVSETSCMLNGADVCEISIRRRVSE